MKITSKPIKTSFVLLCALTFLIAGLVAKRPARAGADGVIAVQNSNLVTDYVWQSNVPVGDLAWNPSDGKLYVSLSSRFGPDGNSVAQLDPLTGLVTSPIYVGSEPGPIEIANDGRTMYVGLDGSHSIRRVDLFAQTAGQSFGFPTDPFSGARYLPMDFAVSPSDPNVVAVAQSREFGSSVDGVAIYDNGIRRPVTESPYPFSASVQFNEKSKLIGLANDVRTYSVVSSGLALERRFNIPSGRWAINYAAGRIYTSHGEVYNAVSGEIVGTFTNMSSYNASFTVDADSGRAFYLDWNGLLRVYDLATFNQTGTLQLPLQPSAASNLRMIRWGSNGLAIRSSNGLISFVTTSLIPTNQPLPSPSLTSTPTPSPAAFKSSFRTVSLPANDIYVDEESSTLFTAIGSRAGSTLGNSVVPVNLQTAESGTPIFVGSEPKTLAGNGDGRTLWVGLSGAGAARRVDIPTLTALDQFSYGSSQSSGPYDATSLAVAPGNPDLVAVPRLYRYSSPPQGGAALFENGVRRQLTGPSHSVGSTNLEFGETAGTLFGLTTSGTISVLNVGATGLVESARFGFHGGQIRYAAGRLYSSTGQVVDAVDGRVRGRAISGLPETNGRTEPDPKNRRIFRINGSDANWRIEAFDIDTFLPLGSISVPGTLSGIRAFRRFGANGLAITDGEKVILVYSTIVNPDTVVPTQPTATPTPMATPTAAPPSLVRRIDLRVAGLVYSERTSALYATVGGGAAPGIANSVTRIDPSTGNIGGSVSIGTQPSIMALADDGDTIYVKLSGVAGIRRFSAVNETAGALYTFSENYEINDIAVPSGQTDAFAVARGPGGTKIYDSGVQRPLPTTGGITFNNILEPSDVSNRLYTYCSQSSGFGLAKLRVTEQGVLGEGFAEELVYGFNVDIKFAGGRLYSTRGHVIDPETFTLLGTLGDRFGSAIEVDTATRRAFLIVDDVMEVYDIDTFLKIGSIALGDLGGRALSLTRFGSNGLAFYVDNQNSPIHYGVYTVLTGFAGPGDIPTVVGFETANILTSEQQPNVAVALVRQGGLTGTTTVRFRTSGQTATGGSDYVEKDEVVTFAPGEARKALSVALLDDQIYEGTETFGVALSEISGGELDVANGGVTITDNEILPIVWISSRTTEEPPPMSPNGGTLKFAVTRSNASFLPVRVDFQTFPTSATPGVDYEAVSGRLIFEPNELVKTVDIPIRGDRIREGSEGFRFVLSGIVNGQIGSNNAVITITDYNFPRRAKFDFDGDNKSDIGVFRPPTGEWWVSRSSDQRVTALPFGLSGDQPVPADFTGDGLTDVAVWRPGSGEWFVLRSEDLTYYSVPFGLAGDVPVPDDFDGDGFADIAVFRPSTGTWYISNSSESVVSVQQFGGEGDKTAVADYDADGRADIAVFRPSTGVWSIRRSNGGRRRVVRFGMAGDIPVPGEFLSTGSAQLALYRPSEGMWYFHDDFTNSFRTFRFGAPGDIPVPGKYSAESLNNIAVFRPSTSEWFLTSFYSQTSTVAQFGMSGDQPLSGMQ